MMPAFTIGFTSAPIGSTSTPAARKRGGKSGERMKIFSHSIRQLCFWLFQAGVSPEQVIVAMTSLGADCKPTSIKAWAGMLRRDPSLAKSIVLSDAEIDHLMELLPTA